MHRPTWGSPLCCIVYQKFKSLWSRHPTLRELHWLPIQARINFKICLLMYRIYTNCSPAYLSSLVTPCSSLQSRRGLRSSSQGDFVVTRSLKKLGNRAFALAGPAEWNKLPVFIRKSSTLSIFKTNLKTYLFKIYYDWFFCYALLCKIPILFRRATNNSLIISAFFLEKKVPELNKFRTIIGAYFMLIFLFHICKHQ